MYLNFAILATCVLLYSIFAGRIDKLPISGPVLFVLLGIVAGPLVFNFFSLKVDGEFIKILAELALALVLFTDAAKTNLRVLETDIKIPLRLLLIGLPLSIVFGVTAGFLIFNGYSWIELAILACILAPTDAALGKAVESNPMVPLKIRESLNVESGLNDGICVPVLFLLMALFTAESIGDISIQYGLSLFAREIGIGLLVGLAVTFMSDKLLHYSYNHKWITNSWKPMIIIALALLCFATAQALGGSGFIACFCGGLLYGGMNKKKKINLLTAAEGTGDTLSLVTWLIFGSVVIAAFLPDITWQVFLYALLSLTLVRMIPVFISLTKSGISFKERLFMGWFGPRGLASIVFMIIVFDLKLPHQHTIILVVVCTVLLSIIFHGISANPFINWLVKKNNN